MNKYLIWALISSGSIFAQDDCIVIKAGESSDLDCKARYLSESQAGVKGAIEKQDDSTAVLECLRELNPVSLGKNLVFNSAPTKVLNFGDLAGKQGAYYNLSDEVYFLPLDDIYSGVEKGIKVFNIKTKAGKTEKIFAFNNGGQVTVKYEDSFNQNVKTSPEMSKMQRKEVLPEKSETKSLDYIRSLNEVAKERISTVKNYFDLRNEKLKSYTEQDQIGQEELTALLFCKKFYESRNMKELYGMTEKELAKLPLYMKTTKQIKKTSKLSKSFESSHQN